MRRALLATCLAFVLLTWPVDAQQAPSQPAHDPAGAGGSRIIMDVVYWAMPGEADETCLRLSPGRVAITVSLEAAGVLQSVRYRFAPYWYRVADAPAEIDTRVTADPRTFEATLAGGRYCYSILNEGGPTDGDATGSVGQAQLVAVKMTLSP